MAIPIFPAGLVSRREPDGSIRDLPWKKSFITQARRYHRDIIPVWVEGRNSDFFYNFARRRKSLGIKANIEMLYLPDEMFSQKGKNIEIYFGKPVPWSSFGDNHTDEEWARKFQDELYRRKTGVVNGFTI
jgi:putative hemolysin